MAGTKAGGIAARETNIKKHGADYYARIGAMGGKNSNTGGFAYDGRTMAEKLLGRPKHGARLAKIAGARGGRISRRSK